MTTVKFTNQLENILILAPTGRDASLISEALGKNSVASEIFVNTDEFCDRLKAPAGAIIVAEEALSYKIINDLNNILADQEAWSDLPVILMTSHREASEASLSKIKAFWPSGNVNLLERPFHIITLINAVTVALRARRRQYQMRDLLLKQIEATRIRDEFISIASHELKTPLTTLKLLLQYNRKFAKADEIKRMVNIAHDQVNRLSRLIEDMLDVSRINSGRLTIEKTKLDLSELANEVAGRYLPMFEATNTELKINTPHPVIGYWDRYRVEQIVTNLLTNAVRYAPGKPVIISTEETITGARIMVKDFGQGISPENQKKIFGRFERAVTSENISGLGLGLYICKEIAERHGGTISVQSQAGEGAKFIVDLPKQAAPVETGRKLDQKSS